MDSVPFLNLEYFFKLIYDIITGGASLHAFLAALKNFLAAIAPYSMALSLVLASGIAYCIIRIRQIDAEERERFNREPEDIATTVGGVANPKWQRVLDHLHSRSSADWKLAILEADILLSELLEKMGYEGDTMADRLKRIERSDFDSLDRAWEAHKVRNRIAHEGAEFEIAEREARRVVSLYADVFKEFKFIS